MIEAQRDPRPTLLRVSRLFWAAFLGSAFPLLGSPKLYGRGPEVRYDAAARWDAQFERRRA